MCAECRTDGIKPGIRQRVYSTGGNEKKIFDMTNPEWYCSGVTELDNSLNALQSNFQSRVHVFPHRDPETVKYAATLLSTWNNHPDPAQRQTQITDPVDWLRDLQRDWDPCLEDFEAISEAMHKMYGDRNQKLDAAMKCMTDFLQGANGLVRICANWIKGNSRAAGWLTQDNKNLYEIAWSELPTGLKSKIKPLIPKNRRFDSMEECFERAADSEVKPDGKNPNRSSHNTSKGSQENNLNTAATNAASDHPYPSKPKHQRPTSQSRTRMINALQRLGSCWSSVKLRSRKEDAYAAGHRHIKHSGARNIHTRQLLQKSCSSRWRIANRTPALLR